MMNVVKTVAHIYPERFQPAPTELILRIEVANPIERSCIEATSHKADLLKAFHHLWRAVIRQTPESYVNSVFRT